MIVIDDSSEEVLQTALAAFHNEKDAAIIAAAKASNNITHILSLDKGFFAQEIIAYVKPKEIVTPGEFLQKFRVVLDK